MDKLKIGVIFGGQSGEHEVSLSSSTSIISVMDKTKYDIIPIGITKEGNWKLFLGDISKIQDGTWLDEAIPAFLSPDPEHKCILTLKDGKESRYYLDVVFPVLWPSWRRWDCSKPVRNEYTLCELRSHIFRSLYG